MRPRSAKIIRRSLIGVIILILLSVFFNYLQTWRNRSRVVREKPQILSSEMVRSADSIEYSQYSDGILRFKIRAHRLLETRLGKSLLEGIEAYDFKPDGTVRHEIRSRHAEYDRDRQLADFSGDVQLFLGDDVELRTDSLHYDLKTGVGTTPDFLQIYSGEISGSARGIHFDQGRESLHLGSEVSFFLTPKSTKLGSPTSIDKLHAVSQRAYWAELAHRFTFQGQARIESDSRILSGDSIEVVSDPNRNDITSLTSAGNASYQSTDGGETRVLSGDQMVLGIGASGALETISVTGQAVFSSATPSEEISLSGGEIVLVFDPAGGSLTEIQGRTGVLFRTRRGTEETRISGDLFTADFAPQTGGVASIHVRNRAAFSTGGSEHSAGNELQADEILMKFSQMDGRSFLESGSASGKVEVSERSNDPSAPSQARRLLADSAQFRFFPKSNQLKDMYAEGHVQTVYEKRSNPDGRPVMNAFRTASEKMTALFALKNNAGAIESVAQWGGFRYTDAARLATAGRSDYDAAKDLLVLKESPRISDAFGSATGELMEYDLKHKILAIHGKVWSTLSAKEGKGAFMGSSAASSPAVVAADEMQYWTESGQARYKGNVRLLSEDQQLQTQFLDIFGGGERIEAQGGVRHLISRKDVAEASLPSNKPKGTGNSQSAPILVKSSRLNYSKGSGALAYSGNVTVRSGNLSLSSGTLDAFLDKEKRFEHATARGEVQIRQGDRECMGEVADWFVDTGKLVVSGNPAEVYDPGRGRSFARRLTSFSADDRILLESR